MNDFILRLRSANCREREPCSDLHALDCLNAHERTGEPRVEPAIPVHVTAETGRKPVRHHLNHAAEGVAIAMSGAYLLENRCRSLGIDAAHGILINSIEVGDHRNDAFGQAHVPDAHDMTEHLDTRCLPQERARDRPERDPCRRLTRTRTLEDGARIVPSILLHASKISVAGPGPGQRRVTRERLEFSRVNRIGRHDHFPL